MPLISDADYRALQTRFNKRWLGYAANINSQEWLHKQRVNVCNRIISKIGSYVDKNKRKPTYNDMNPELMKEAISLGITETDVCRMIRGVSVEDLRREFLGPRDGYDVTPTLKSHYKGWINDVMRDRNRELRRGV